MIPLDIGRTSDSLPPLQAALEYMESIIDDPKGYLKKGDGEEAKGMDATKRA